MRLPLLKSTRLDFNKPKTRANSSSVEPLEPQILWASASPTAPLLSRVVPGYQLDLSWGLSHLRSPDIPLGTEGSEAPKPSQREPRESVAS